MTRPSDRLYELLPAVYRINDTKEKIGEEALKALLDVIAEQIRLVEDDIGQLYDNWFIETCAEWLVPYIGDLLGVRGLHQVETGFSQRARVANTLAYRRRKGTATMLEQLAHDTTLWHARAAEFFQMLETTQYINHLRPANLRTPDLRQADALELLDGPFDTIAHTADVRHIASGRGKYNIPNVGLYLWRLQSYGLSGVKPRPLPGIPDGRFTFSPLGNSTPLFNRPRTEKTITHLAEEPEVPDAIRPAALCLDLQESLNYNLSLPESERTEKSTYYGRNASLAIINDGIAIRPEDVVSMDLSGWERPPARICGVLTGQLPTSLALTAALTSTSPAVQVTLGAEGPFQAILTAIPTTPDKAAELLTEALGRVPGSAAFQRIRVVAADTRLLVLSADPSPNIIFATTADDATTLGELKLDSLVPVEAALSSILKPFPKLEKGKLNLVISGIGPREISLSPLPIGIPSACQSLQDAIRSADDDPAFQKACVLPLDDRRLLVVPGLGAGATSAGPVIFDAAGSDPATVYRLGLKDRVGIDVRHGRIAFPLGSSVGEVRADFIYGFSGDMGGGPYDRRWVRHPGEPLPTAYQNSVAEPHRIEGVHYQREYLRVAGTSVSPPANFTTISEALDYWAGTLLKPHAVIEICDNDSYAENVAIEMDANDLIIQAENKKRPVLLGNIAVTGNKNGRLALNGLLVAGTVSVEGASSLYQLDIIHSTLVPGGQVDVEGQPLEPDLPSLEVKTVLPELKVSFYRSISGPIHLPTGISSLEIRDSILESPVRDQMGWVSPVLVSRKVTPAKIPSSPPAQMTITIGEEGPYPLTLRRPRGIRANQLITPSVLATCLETAIRAIHNAGERPTFRQARVLREGMTLIVLPGIPEKVSFAPLGDSRLIDNLGLDPGHVSERVALVSGPIQPKDLDSSPALDLAFGSNRKTIHLSLHAKKGQLRRELKRSIRGIRDSSAFENAIVAFQAKDSRLVIVPGEADIAPRFHSGPAGPTSLSDLSLASDHFVIAAVATGEQPGPPTSIVRSTVLGQVHVKELSLASESIFVGRIYADRRQTGCVRFSFVTDGSRIPRCYRCQPEIEIKTRGKSHELQVLGWLKPSFASTQYGDPAYCQLSLSCPIQIRTGAEDGGEMGAFYFLKQPQRKGNLLASLDEYLRAGLEAGLFYVT